MSFAIVIRGLALFGYHGVYAEEQKNGQRFLIDFVVSDEACLATDDVNAAVSYADIVAVTHHAFQARRFNLIEALAAHLGDTLLTQFPLIEKIIVSVHKPAAPMEATFDDIIATVERRRND